MVSAYLILAYILAYIGLIAIVYYIISLKTYYRGIKEPEPMTDKEVSIIIPAYNEEEGIARTIESAKALDYPSENLEIVVVDDGSKDNTFNIAKEFASEKNPKVRVFSKSNGGKGTALNFGLGKVKSEIVVSMDADTSVRSDTLKRMVGYFQNEDVMCVAPSMGIYKPRGLWGRVVQIEYYMGVFLRKSFATANAVHITPGAFSAYRKKFFDEQGGYDEGNLTEDLEIALRIQDKHYMIENAPKAVAYTQSPQTFRSLLYQRRRWYAGLMKNLWAYKRIFGFKHGALGAVVLPVAVITVLMAIILTVYSTVKIGAEIVDELTFLQSINFEFNTAYEFNTYFFEVFFLSLFSQPIFLFAILFLFLLGFYVAFSRKEMLFQEGIKINFLLFSLFYSFLFTFWWIISIFYVIFNRDVKWREDGKRKKDPDKAAIR